MSVQVKLWNPLRTRAIPERFWSGDSLRTGAVSSVCTFSFYFYLSAPASSAAAADIECDDDDDDEDDDDDDRGVVGGCQILAKDAQ